MKYYFLEYIKKSIEILYFVIQDFNME